MVRGRASSACAQPAAAGKPASLARPHPVAGGWAFALEGEPARVRVFDLAGRERFDSGWVQGRGRLVWDLRSPTGMPVPNGTYLYGLEVGVAGERRLQWGKLAVVR